MGVSAGLVKSFLSLEEDVLTAGLGQGLKYWSPSRILAAAIANHIPLDSVGLGWLCVYAAVSNQVSGCQWVQTSSKCRATSYKHQYRFGDEAGRGYKHAWSINKI